MVMAVVMRPGLGVLAAVLAIAWTVALASGSQAPGETLPVALRTHLQAEQFQIVTGVRGFPLGVRDKLQELFGSGTLDIANPGEPFQRTPAPNASLPLRRLAVAGCASDNHCLIYYERGGATVSHRAVLVHWSPAETRLEFGGTAPAALTNIDDVRKAMLSGAVKHNATTPW